MELLRRQNEALTNFVQTIEPAYNGTKVTFLDTQPVFADILDNYRSYGFKDNSTFCDIYASISTQPALFLPQCGIPLAQYVWWNSAQYVRHLGIRGCKERTMTDFPHAVLRGPYIRS